MSAMTWGEYKDKKKKRKPSTLREKQPPFQHIFKQIIDKINITLNGFIYLENRFTKTLLI